MSEPARSMSHPVPEQPVSYAAKYQALIRKLKGLRPEAPVSIRHKPVPMRPKATTRPRQEAFEETDSLLVQLRKKKKAELYERAKQIDLQGRSNMNKEQLVLALAAHDRKRMQQTTAGGAAALSRAISPPAPSATPAIAARPRAGSSWIQKRSGTPSWLGKPLQAQSG